MIISAIFFKAKSVSILLVELLFCELVYLCKFQIYTMHFNNESHIGSAREFRLPYLHCNLIIPCLSLNTHLTFLLLCHLNMMIVICSIENVHYILCASEHVLRASFKCIRPHWTASFLCLYLELCMMVQLALC
jgi:hypothetical protein